MKKKNMQLPTAFTQHINCVNAVIETPKGCAAKYNYDAQTQMFRLKKILPAGMVFPFHFGFIPGTMAEDGDPLDVLVLMDEPSWPGCIIECMAIGVLVAEQAQNNKMVRNDRVIATARASSAYNEIEDLSSFNHLTVKEIENFFYSYTRHEKKDFRILEKKDRDFAINLIKKHLINGNN